MKLSRIFREVFRKNWIQFTMLVLAVAGVVFLQLLPPQILKTVVDDYLGQGRYEGIFTLAALYLSAVLLSYGCEFIKTVCTAFIGQKAVLNIRRGISAKLAKLPIEYYNKTPAGDVMSRFTQDIEAVNTMFSDGLINMIVDLFKIIGILVSVCILSPPLFLYTLLILPVVVLLSNIFRKKIYNAQLLNRKSAGKINSGLQEAYSGLRLYKIFGYENRLSKAFRPLNENQIAIRRKVNLMDAAFPCVMQILKAVVICAFILLTTQEVNLIFGITAGALAASIDLLGRLFVPVEELATEFQSIQQVFAAFSRVKEFMNEPEEQRTVDYQAAGSGNGDIAFDRVTFSYDKTVNILQDVSFRVGSGQKVALVGRTGSGKTTVLNLLAGLYPAGGGEITVGGFNPFTMPAALRRRIIGIVPQTVTTFTGSITELITLGDERISEDDVIAALKAVGLYADIEKLPNRHRTVIGEGEHNLSFGQMQLLTLARAVVTNPPILLLDELTSGMDAVTEAAVLSAIKNVSENRTIVTISHRLSGIVDADYVYMFSYGKIIEQGSPAGLSEGQGWYAKYKQLEDLGWQAF